MKTLMILLSLSAPAGAQGLSGAGTCISQDHSTIWTTTEESCRRANGSFSPIVIGIPTIVTGPSGLSITSAALTCPASRELVMRSNGSLGCAADVTPARTSP